MRVRAPLCPPYSSVAQLVEPSAVNRRVGGSFPPAGVILDSYSNTYGINWFDSNTTPRSGYKESS